MQSFKSCLDRIEKGQSNINSVDKLLKYCYNLFVSIGKSSLLIPLTPEHPSCRASQNHHVMFLNLKITKVSSFCGFFNV